MRWLPFMSLTALLVAVPSAPSSAMPAQTGFGSQSAPAADAVDVPTNVLLQLGVAEVAPAEATITLQADGGDPASLAASFEDSLALSAVEELQPNTRYTVLAAGGPQDVPLEFSFTTGQGRDDTPPVVTGDVLATAETVGGMWGHQRALNVTVPSVTDDSGLASVRIYAVGSDGNRALCRAILARSEESVFVPDVGADTSFELVAVDLAGNESEPAAFTVAGEGGGGALFGCGATSGGSSWSHLAVLALFAGGLRAGRGRKIRIPH